MKQVAPYEPQKKPRVRKLVSLQRIVQEVSAAPDLSAASRIIVKRVRETMHTDVCSIYLTEPTHPKPCAIGHRGLEPGSDRQGASGF